MEPEGGSGAVGFPSRFPLRSLREGEALRIRPRASVAGMVATREPRLAARVSVGGRYDLSRPSGAPRIQERFVRETVGTKEAIRARPALYSTDKISTPVLSLHGSEDEHPSPKEEKEIAENPRKSGGHAETRFLPGPDHWIPTEFQSERAFPFPENRLNSIP